MCLFLPVACETNSVAENHAPQAAFSYRQDSGDPGIVRFFNESKNASSYRWDFGDGRGVSSEQNPGYVYASGGAYTVTLEVQNTAGADSAARTLNIDRISATALFTCKTDGLSAVFKNLSEHVSGYAWDFGDGNTSTEENPEHTYAKRGVYTVKLNGLDPYGLPVLYKTEVDATQFPFATLVWADEFNGEGLPDPDKWGYEKGYVRNKELQYYTERRPENTQQKGGNLHITARRDSASIEGDMREITSASILTRAQWKYCKIEARIKVPVSLGSWPAIWLLPRGRTWPDGGEIDLMEQVGFEPAKFHFNVHTKRYNGYNGSGSRGTSVKLPGRADDRFHVFALEWYGDRLDFFLDGEKTYTFRKEGGYDVWPFDHEFYVIFNLAFGGTWGGTAGVDKTSLPLEYLIDYIRVYQ